MGEERQDSARSQQCGPGRKSGRKPGLSRRRVLQGGALGAAAAGLGYTTWFANAPTALASTPSPHGFSHAQAESGNLFYDYGSQNLMEIASAVDLPELIEFQDDGEQATAGLALADPSDRFSRDRFSGDGFSGDGFSGPVALPRARPLAEPQQGAQSVVSLPPKRRIGGIPQKLDVPTGDTLAQSSTMVARAPEAAVVGGSRHVYTPSDALGKRLGRRRRTLNIHAVNVGERLNINYFRNGRYDTGALAELDHLFRDRHSRKVAEIDPGVYDQLFAISNIFQGREINMLSGYRAPETNEAMRRRLSGVARFSYHVRAQAVDFYIFNVAISELHIAALKLSAGGVGYYPGSNFVHIDTGPLRNWPSRYAGLGLRYRQT